MFFTVWMLVSGGETLEAQTNRKIKALQTQKKEIQKGLTRSRKELKTTEKTVATKLRDISMIANRLEAAPLVKFLFLSSLPDLIG